MKFLDAFDRFSGKNIAWLSLVLTAVGVLFPDRLRFLSSATFWLFAFMTFVSSLGAGFRDLRAVVLHPKPILAVLFALHILMPLAAFGIGTLCFPGSPYFTAGLVLENCIPTGVVSLMWVAMNKGNTPLTLCIVLVDTLLAPFVVPLSLKLLIGSQVEMDVAGMVGNLITMIAIPALLAMLCNQFTHGRAGRKLQRPLNPFSKLALMLIIVANATGIAPYIRGLNGKLLAVIAVAIGISVLGFLAGFVTARLLKTEEETSLSILINCGMRNINAGALLAAQYFNGEVLFPVVTSSLMMHSLAGLSIHLLRHGKKSGGPEDRISPE